MTTIIDYGLGNIKAFVNLFERLSLPIKIAKCAEDVRNSTKIILPGVGSFDYAMTQFNNSGMRDAVENKVFGSDTPVLGICVGMQMLASGSEEGKLPGLGWIEGYVRMFDGNTIPYKSKLPHMGWNSISPKEHYPLMNGLNNTSRFYFLHSYYFVSANENEIMSTTLYGNLFTSSIAKRNIFGIQFHPEKSHLNGITLLKNFALL